MSVFNDINSISNRIPGGLNSRDRGQVEGIRREILRSAKRNSGSRTNEPDPLNVSVVGLPIMEYNSELMVTIFTTASKRATDKALRHLQNRIKWAAGLQDAHTLSMMKRRGSGIIQNPYAKKHRPSGKILGHERWRVHRQSSSLYHAIKRRVAEHKGSSGYEGSSGDVYIDEAGAPHAKFVIWGTQFMISRNFILWTWNNEQSRVEDIVDKEFKHAMQLWKVRDP